MGTPEKLQKTPLIDQLINDALQRFNSTKSIMSPYGQREAYTSFHAISDTLKASRISPRELFFTITQESHLTPKDIARERDLGGDLSGGFSSWDDYLVFISEQILELEIESRHPEVIGEELRRTYYWETRRKSAKSA